MIIEPCLSFFMMVYYVTFNPLAIKMYALVTLISVVNLYDMYFFPLLLYLWWRTRVKQGTSYFMRKRMLGLPAGVKEDWKMSIFACRQRWRFTSPSVEERGCEELNFLTKVKSINGHVYDEDCVPKTFEDLNIPHKTVKKMKTTSSSGSPDSALAT